VRRHTWFNPFFDWLLNFLMGQNIDTPISVWQEMFLPSEVGNRINEFFYTDADGNERQLVCGEEIVYKAEGRHQILDKPRLQWPRELIIGLVIMLILGFFYYLQTKNVAGQILLGLSISILGLFFGLSSLLLWFISLFTNHDYAHHNMNLIFVTPLILAAIPLGIRYAFARSFQTREKYDLLLRILWLLVLLGIIVSMLLKLLPCFWQNNLVDELLLLPIAAILALEPTGLKELFGRIFWRWS